MEFYMAPAGQRLSVAVDTKLARLDVYGLPCTAILLTIVLGKCLRTPGFQLVALHVSVVLAFVAAALYMVFYRRNWYISNRKVVLIGIKATFYLPLLLTASQLQLLLLESKGKKHTLWTSFRLFVMAGRWVDGFVSQLLLPVSALNMVWVQTVAITAVALLTMPSVTQALSCQAEHLHLFETLQLTLPDWMKTAADLYFGNPGPSGTAAVYLVSVHMVTGWILPILFGLAVNRVARRGLLTEQQHSSLVRMEYLQAINASLVLVALLLERHTLYGVAATVSLWNIKVISLFNQPLVEACHLEF